MLTLMVLGAPILAGIGSQPAAARNQLWCPADKTIDQWLNEDENRCDVYDNSPGGPDWLDQWCGLEVLTVVVSCGAAGAAPNFWSAGASWVNSVKSLDCSTKEGGPADQVNDWFHELTGPVGSKCVLERHRGGLWEYCQFKTNKLRSAPLEPDVKVGTWDAKFDAATRRWYLQANVENVGVGGAVEFTVAYASRTGATLASYQVEDLVPGSARALPRYYPGACDFDLEIKVDPNDDIPETNRSNNQVRALNVC